MGHKVCPSCGNPQSYDEWVARPQRMKCLADRCRPFGHEYGVGNAFYMDRWEKRMSKGENHAKAKAVRLLQERLEEEDKNKTERTATQQELMDKAAGEGHAGTVWKVAFNKRGTVRSERERACAHTHIATAKRLARTRSSIAHFANGRPTSSFTQPPHLFTHVYAPLQWLASCATDKTVRVWDFHNRTELMKLEGHAQGVNAVAFSPSR